MIKAASKKFCNEERATTELFFSKVKACTFTTEWSQLHCFSVSFETLSEQLYVPYRNVVNSAIETLIMILLLTLNLLHTFSYCFYC